jgi:F0F1-type ATP synthase epsilon subunit
MAQQPKIYVLIRSREKVLYNDKAYSVSSVNDRGPFDVLPMHANFVSLIKKIVVIDANKPTEKSFPVDSGVLSASKDVVKVYLGI